MMHCGFECFDKKKKKKNNEHGRGKFFGAKFVGPDLPGSGFLGKLLLLGPTKRIKSLNKNKIVTKGKSWSKSFWILITREAKKLIW